MRICVMNISEKLNAENRAFLERFVTMEKAARIQKFWHWEDQQRSLFGDLLIRKMIVEHTGRANDELRFETTDFGKPYLKGEAELYFNISHSGDWVACAIHTESIGIDVEVVQDIDLSISEMYFSQQENNEIVRAEDSIDRFFDYWTLKESFIKYIGKGLSQPLNSFTIHIGQEKITVESKVGLASDSTLKQYNLGHPYKMAVCTKVTHFPENYEVCTMEDIIHWCENEIITIPRIT